MRQAERLLAERYGEGVVPVPSRGTFYRLLSAMAEGRHIFGAATSRRSQGRRPEALFTPTIAARPGEVAAQPSGSLHHQQIPDPQRDPPPVHRPEPATARTCHPAALVTSAPS
jgi:hypothetical protein